MNFTNPYYRPGNAKLKPARWTLPYTVLELSLDSISTETALRENAAGNMAEAAHTEMITVVPVSSSHQEQTASRLPCLPEYPLADFTPGDLGGDQYSNGDGQMDVSQLDPLQSPTYAQCIALNADGGLDRYQEHLFFTTERSNQGLGGMIKIDFGHRGTPSITLKVPILRHNARASGRDSFVGEAWIQFTPGTVIMERKATGVEPFHDAKVFYTNTADVCKYQPNYDLSRVPVELVGRLKTVDLATLPPALVPGPLMTPIHCLKWWTEGVSSFGLDDGLVDGVLASPTGYLQETVRNLRFLKQLHALSQSNHDAGITSEKKIVPLGLYWSYPHLFRRAPRSNELLAKSIIQMQDRIYKGRRYPMRGRVGTVFSWHARIIKKRCSKIRCTDLRY